MNSQLIYSSRMGGVDDYSRLSLRRPLSGDIEVLNRYFRLAWQQSKNVCDSANLTVYFRSRRRDLYQSFPDCYELLVRWIVSLFARENWNWSCWDLCRLLNVSILFLSRYDSALNVLKRITGSLYRFDNCYTVNKVNGNWYISIKKLIKVNLIENNECNECSRRGNRF